MGLKTWGYSFGMVKLGFLQNFRFPKIIAVLKSWMGGGGGGIYYDDFNRSIVIFLNDILTVI